MTQEFGDSTCLKTPEMGKADNSTCQVMSREKSKCLYSRQILPFCISAHGLSPSPVQHNKVVALWELKLHYLASEWPVQNPHLYRVPSAH